MPKILWVLLFAALLASTSQARSFKQIQDSGKLLVCTEKDYEPFTYLSDLGKRIGYDIEVATLVASKLGLKVEFVTFEWSELLKGFEDGKCNAVFDQITVTDERQMKYDFTVPYTVSRAAVITEISQENINSFKNLEGKKVAVSKGSNWYEIASKYKADIVIVSGFDEGIEAVLNKKVDATINDSVSFFVFHKNNPDKLVRIAALGDEPIYSAAVVRKSDAELLSKIDSALSKLLISAEIAKISVKYFGSDITQYRSFNQ